MPHRGATDDDAVRITWIGVANWLFEVGATRVLYNAYFTRISEDQFYGGPAEFNHTYEPQVPDEATVQRVVHALTDDGRIDYVLTGHSHFDHAFDVAAVAKLSGAQVIGSQSTVLQAIAQDVPESQCTIVSGGERIELAPDLTVSAVRWAHGLAEMAPELSAPRELDVAPIRDPITGGLKAGGLDAFPNGGGARGFLFEFAGPSDSVSWYVTDASTPGAPDAKVVLDGVDYGRPLDNLTSAMRQADLQSVDLWIALGVPFPEAESTIELGLPILRPRYVIPHHFDPLFHPFEFGLDPDGGFENDVITALVDQAGAQLHVPRQYLDSWDLHSSGLKSRDSSQIRAQLGIPDSPNVSQHGA